MWLPILLCYLALTNGLSNAGWKPNHEYIYQIRGRTLTSLDEISNSYTGIFLNGKLIIQSTSDGHLKAKVPNLQYSNIHTKLQKGWKQQIPDSKLNYEDIPLSSKPFKIVMNNGVIHDLIMDKDVSNWESNIIKGIVNQLQLDVQGQNQMNSSINTFPENLDNAVFKTMEKSVTGESETLYEIHPFPEYVLQSEPWLAPLKQWKSNEKLIEVVKSRNYTHSKERPSYHFGLNGVKDLDINNKMGQFFARISVSRFILSGNLDDFVIQSSVTEDQVNVKPTLQDRQKGSTRSIVNLTLLSMEGQQQEFENVANPVNVGLVYQYNKPSSQFDERRRSWRNDPSSEESSWESYEENVIELEDPEMKKAPASPLLPLTVGYNGKSISKKENVREMVHDLAQTIGEELKESENIPERSSLSKFVRLASLIRVMDYEDIKTVADQLYTKEEHGAAALAWKTYRDAVAQAGTGPALLCIEECLRSGRVSGNEAAQFVATAASAARQPTLRYIQRFFNMVQDENNRKQQSLNESLLLSFTKLVREVYVSEDHLKYPVHSFGRFDTTEGRNFIKDKVIPYLSEKLEEAVSNADTHKIHVYIRALGNVGNQQILSVFKPYLEGIKKMSQFQRVLIVMALGKLVYTNPSTARSVLYKIYQNPREYEQVRVAAVYQLIKTHPPADMLQRMATYTNIDTSNYVNSAVKSVIEEAAKVRGEQFSELRAAAQSAKPLLTNEEYGHQYSKFFLRNYISKQSGVKQLVATIGGEDSVIPRGIHYMLRGRFGGVKHEVVNMQWMVSSVEDLFNLFDQQTKIYRQFLNQKQRQESSNSKWSSEYIAKLLNVQSEQREQLEAYLSLQIDSLHKVWSIDNHTVENMYEALRLLEHELKNGKHFHYTKMAIYPEIALSFPTSWGLPFIYTYDRPTTVHLESDVKVESKSPLCSEDGLQNPEVVDVSFKVNGFVSGKIQSQFGFFAPFNHKRYSAGYDKNFQIILPDTNGGLQIDIHSKQLIFRIENIDLKSGNLMHFSTWPYTTQEDIWTLNSKREIIVKDRKHEFKTVFGKKNTGIAFYLQTEGDKKLDYGFFYNKMQKENSIFSLLGSWPDDDIQHIEVNFGIDGSQTSTRKMSFLMGCQSKWDQNNKPSDSSLKKESWERQNAFIQKCNREVKNADIRAFDLVASFEGRQQIKYTGTVSYANNKNDPKKHMLMHFMKTTGQEQDMKISLSVECQVPTSPSLDLNAALEFDPTSTIHIEGTIENKNEKPTHVNVGVELSRSENRKQHLKENPEYENCKQQKMEGNTLQACAVLTSRANLLDKFSVNLSYKNLSPAIRNVTYKWYSVLRQQWYPYLSENMEDVQSNNRLKIEGQYSPDLLSVNFSVSTEFGKMQVENLEMSPLAKSVMVYHPDYDVKTRVQAHYYNYDAYEPICIVDSNSIVTVDNKTYPIQLNQDWTILLQYLPHRPSSMPNKYDLTVSEQLNQQIESYITYIRAYGQANQKEIKIVLQSPYTSSKVIDVTLKPSESSEYPKLYIQDEEISYDDQSSSAYNKFMQVSKLPKHEIKLEIRGAFDVVFDGNRVKIVVNDKFRDASRGLCGTFTGQSETDFTHPGNCLIRSPEVFVFSNSIPETQRTKRINDMMMIQAEEKKCYQKSVHYVPVVSSQDSEDRCYRDNQNMKKRTKYIVVDNQTCFSVEPLSVCKKGYKQKSVSRSVPAYCVGSSRITDMMKNQIDNGANPSFKNKSPNREVSMPVAQKCYL